MMRQYVLIEARDVSACQATMETFDAGGGAKTFEAALNDTGTPSAPATWYHASLPLDDAQMTTLLHGMPTAQRYQYDPDTDPAFPDRTLAALGLTRIGRE